MRLTGAAALAAVALAGVPVGANNAAKLRSWSVSRATRHVRITSLTCLIAARSALSQGCSGSSALRYWRSSRAHGSSQAIHGRNRADSP